MAAKMYTIKSCVYGTDVVGDLTNTIYVAGEICSINHDIVKTDDGYLLRVTYPRYRGSFELPLFSETEEEATTEAFEYMLPDYEEDHRCIIYPAEYGITKLLEADELRTIYGDFGANFANDDDIAEHALYADHTRETLIKMANLLLLKGAISRGVFDQLIEYFEEYIAA